MSPEHINEGQHLLVYLRFIILFFELFNARPKIRGISDSYDNSPKINNAYYMRDTHGEILKSVII